jgi:hypothetical protein
MLGVIPAEPSASVACRLGGWLHAGMRSAKRDDGEAHRPGALPSACRAGRSRETRRAGRMRSEHAGCEGRSLATLPKGVAPSVGRKAEPKAEYSLLVVRGGILVAGRDLTRGGGRHRRVPLFVGSSQVSDSEPRMRDSWPCGLRRRDRPAAGRGLRISTSSS